MVTVTVIGILDIPPIIFTTISINPDASEPINCPDVNSIINTENKHQHTVISFCICATYVYKVHKHMRIRFQMHCYYVHTYVKTCVYLLTANLPEINFIKSVVTMYIYRFHNYIDSYVHNYVNYSVSNFCYTY